MFVINIINLVSEDVLPHYIVIVVVVVTFVINGRAANRISNPHFVYSMSSGGAKFEFGPEDSSGQGTRYAPLRAL